MLIGTYGNVGSGKTILVTEIASKVPKNVPIKSNFKLIGFPNYEPLEVEELLTLEPSKNGIVVLIDEAYTWLEARVSMSKLNRYVSYVGFQSRKRDLDIMITSQLRSAIDLRFKDMENLSIYCYDRPKPKTSKADFRYRVFRGFRSKKFIFPFKKAEKLFGRYDTKQVILPPDIAELQAEMEIANPKKLNDTVDKLVSMIQKKKDFSKIEKTSDITHDLVKDFLLRTGKPFAFEPYVYVRLRAMFKSGDFEND